MAQSLPLSIYPQQQKEDNKAPFGGKDMGIIEKEIMLFAKERSSDMEAFVLKKTISYCFGTNDENKTKLDVTLLKSNDFGDIIQTRFDQIEMSYTIKLESIFEMSFHPFNTDLVRSLLSRFQSQLSYRNMMTIIDNLEKNQKPIHFDIDNFVLPSFADQATQYSFKAKFTTFKAQNNKFPYGFTFEFLTDKSMSAFQLSKELQTLSTWIQSVDAKLCTQNKQQQQQGSGTGKGGKTNDQNKPKAPSEFPSSCGQILPGPENERRNKQSIFSQVKIVPVAGDGSCQFRSVAASLIQKLFQMRVDTTNPNIDLSNDRLNLRGRNATYADYFYVMIVILLKWFALVWICDRKRAVSFLEDHSVSGNLENIVIRWYEAIVGGFPPFANQLTMSKEVPIPSQMQSQMMGVILRYYDPKTNKLKFENKADRTMNPSGIGSDASMEALYNSNKDLALYCERSSAWSHFGGQLELLAMSYGLQRQIVVWRRGFLPKTWCTTSVNSGKYDGSPLISISVIDMDLQFMKDPSMRNNLDAALRNALHVVYEPNIYSPQDTSESGHYDTVYVLLKGENPASFQVFDAQTGQNEYPFVQTTQIPSSILQSTSTSTSQTKFPDFYL